MEKIRIDLAMWESSISPIYTKNVNVELAEKRLLHSAIQSYGADVVEDYITNKKEYDNEKWTSEYEHFCEWLCAEEEAIVIECGGKYYEDMTEEEYAMAMQESL